MSDIISYSEGIPYKAFTGIGHLYRLKDDLTYEIKSFELGNILSDTSYEDNFTLNEFDQIIIFNKDSFINEETIIISGMVNSPNSFEFRDRMTIEDLVLLSNGIRMEADLEKVEIERMNLNSTADSSGYVEIIALSYPKDKNFILKAFDRVHFRKLSGFKFQETIEIKGEVKFPGVYSLTGNSDRISDLITRAGGTTDQAYLESSKIERVEGDLGLLLLDLKKVIRNNNSKSNFILKPGDVITIPKVNDIVTIKGAIGFKFINGENDVINSPFHKGKRANYYIKTYGGGYDKKAAKRNVYVVGSNGLVRDSKFFGLIKPEVHKGDKIMVNYKPVKEKKEKKEKLNWNDFIENTTLKITGIATLWILLNKVNL